MTQPTGPPPPALLKLAARLERDGQRLEAQALRAVVKAYGNLSLADLVALLSNATGSPSPQARVQQLELLLDAFNRAASELAQPAPQLLTLLREAVTTGTTAGAQMLAVAAANPDLIEMFRVRPDREIELARSAADRLERYWGKEQRRLADDVQSVLLEGLERGQSPRQMAARLRERTKVSRSRALLIVINETSNAMSAGNEAAQREAGVTEYEWLTAGDKRVRDEHRPRNGKRFRWDAPPSDGHPGQAIRCRCTALAVIPEGFR